MNKAIRTFKAVGSDRKYYTITEIVEEHDNAQGGQIKRLETSDGIVVIHVRDQMEYSIPTKHISLKRQK
jgi:coenzyme F420-reducing hydrogenase beta subunit